MKKYILFIYVSIIFLIMFSCQVQRPVETGLDRITEFSHLFKNKRIGIIANHTAYNSNNEHIVNIFFDRLDVKVNALFGPEHGIRGRSAAGEEVAHQINTEHNIPIYSLYGKHCSGKMS